MSFIISITNCSLLHLLVLLSPWSFASFIAEASSAAVAAAADVKSPFKIIFDGGSTGSRLHIFEFVEVVDDENENENENENDRENGGNSNSNSPTIGSPHTSKEETNTNTDTNSTTKVQCVRRGSSRADIPLSAFGRLPSEQNNDNNPLNSTQVAAHLLPLFEYAANIIPSNYYETTGVYYQATAGMRLLEESEQEDVYDAVFQGLMGEESFVFRGIQRKDISTLSGEMEAYYGALAANFLQGIIDTELRLVSAHNNNNNNNKQQQGETPDHPVGALDMGGSSTQIVYIANHQSLNNNDDDDEIDTLSTSRDSPMTCPINQQQQQPLNIGVVDQSQNTCRLSDEHFFSTSYLSYGVDQIRERLWNTLVAEYVASEEQEQNENPVDTDTTCAAKVISNPCANKGFEVEYEGYTLFGSGNTEECSRQMKRLIPHPEKLHDLDAEIEEWTVGGVEHPPIRGKFLAMSLYFFSLDSLRVFSKAGDEEAHIALDQAWPNPSIDELQNALDGLCSRDWHGDMALQEGVHDFTRKEVLPHRCLETVYMVTLLKDGFGFHPSSRDITFTFLVDGDEVEWTLGMALAMNAEERTAAAAAAATVTTPTTTTPYDDYNFNDNKNEERNEEICNETGNNTFLKEEFRIQSVLPNSHFFSVTLPPTHCC